MGVLDLVAIAYFGYAARKGCKRGLAVELPSAISIGIFFVTGCGLYRWTGRTLAELGHLTGQTLGVAGFVGLVVSTVVTVRCLRKRVQDWVERRYSVRQRALGGMVVGAVRAFLLVCVALLVLVHWPLRSLTQPFAEGSTLGRCLTKWVLPVYEKTHGAL
jgi:branched-subunit amino acid ABC-type transport system permease component